MNSASIIDAAQLASRLARPGTLLVDVRSADAWRASTLPGAVHLDAYSVFIDRSDDEGIQHLVAAAAQALAEIGAFSATQTIYFETATGMVSPRALWFHELLGLPNGRILDGGIDAWHAIAGELAPGAGASSTIALERRAVAPAAWRAESIASYDEVTAADGVETVVVDVRRFSEYQGEFVHPCCARGGRIPGSVHLFWEDVLQGGSYRSPSEILARATEAGLDPRQTLILYCHRGARAATVFYALRMAGFSKLKVFVGSWHEWAERASGVDPR
ncbi:sulfurtransferase [Halotalea alkalilenta]|uniref:Rhodanese domain-containing protein n=1 Tax=Halotalea alkalilenta TaxID=376489 RepID=A0A172YAQ7_9GAMM|nr:rhodanese-like domain-containing protein [Halotalea alkalilenta]ANF56319.1 hypothetical protein A5892_01610 [Halotalea alkalilenta]